MKKYKIICGQKSGASIVHKGNNIIHCFYRLFVVFLIVNTGIFAAGYCRAQNLELLSFPLGKIPLDKISFFNESGYNIPKGTFMSFKSPATRMQRFPANLISPARQKCQERPLSGFNPHNTISVNGEPVGNQNGQNTTQNRSADGFTSGKERLYYLLGHFSSGLLGAIIALLLARKLHRIGLIEWR